MVGGTGNGYFIFIFLHSSRSPCASKSHADASTTTDFTAAAFR